MSDVSREDLERCKSVVGKAFESQEISITDEQLEAITKDIMGISFSHGGGYSSDIILGFTKGYIDHGLYGSNMEEEIFDTVDENGQPTGKTVTRSQAHAQGIRHRTAHIWVVRENGDKTEVLLQKRALNKDSFPGRYDTSSAGHIQAGDEPLESAVRELSEEFGIQANPDDLHFVGTFPIQYEKEFHGKPFKDNEIAFVYVYDKDVDVEKLTIQKEELDSVEWFNLEEVYQACQPPRDEKFCVPMGGLEIVGYAINPL